MRNNILQIVFAILSFSGVCNAQVGIGTTTPQGALEITSANNGLIIPRVALAATNVATVTTPTTSEIVYNTTTSAAGPNQVTPGFYYWSGALWIRLATGNSSDWTTTGNAGTTAGTNFLGTTDAQDLRFKTNATDRLNISNANGQVQSYFAGTAGAPAYSWNGDSNTGVFQSAADNLSLTTNGTEGLRLRTTGNVTIGTTYASANVAPNNGLRVEGQTVVGKASGEDTRDKFSTHSSATAYQNINGYPNNASSRAISGYADAGGIGIFGSSNGTGYGVVGLTQNGSISGFVQSGEGVLGQADGGVATGIPIGVHGIIDEAAAGNNKAVGMVGENNTLSVGSGFQGGPYGTNRAVAGVYGNIGSRVASANTNSYLFGVVGDLLTVSGGTIPDGSGGVLGFGGSNNFGMLGYRGLNGTYYSVYGGGADADVAAGNNGNRTTATPNNHIGLGITGGFMGGYVKGNQYGLMSKGQDFGMYVQGNTVVNQPIVQLSDSNETKRTKTYLAASTEVDITTRGTGSLTNGEAFVSFKEAFKNNVSQSEGINVTVTPTAETNGVFVSKVTADGFYIKENKAGSSNAAFNWTAIGTRAGFENGVELSETILSKNFDEKMDGVMNNDGTGNEGTPVYYDGQNVRFERIPESLVKYAKKQNPKK